MVENIRLEGSIAFADFTLAGQRTPFRFPRKQAIRSIYFDADTALTIATGATEILSSLEAIDTVEILYDERVIRVRGDEIAATMAIFWGVPPIVGAVAYIEGAVAATQDFDSVFRIPIGCTAAPDKNITINVSLSGEAVWSETTANTSGTMTLFIFADYVDGVETEYATWDDRRVALAAQTELTPTETFGTDIVGCSLVCRDSDTAYTANTTALCENTLAANYENVLTLLRLVMGEMTHDIQTVQDLLQIDNPVWVQRRAPDGTGVSNLSAYLRVEGAYILLINLQVTALPRLIVNAGTTNLRVLMWFATPAREQAATPPTPSRSKPTNEAKDETLQKSSVSPGTIGANASQGSGIFRRRVSPPMAALSRGR